MVNFNLSFSQLYLLIGFIVLHGESPYSRHFFTCTVTCRKKHSFTLENEMKKRTTIITKNENFLIAKKSYERVIWLSVSVRR